MTVFLTTGDANLDQVLRLTGTNRSNPLAVGTLNIPAGNLVSVPLSTVRFVDVGTTLAPALQDGSAVRPFGTFAQALASAPSGAVAFWVAPGDYSAQSFTVPATITQFALVGMTGPEIAQTVSIGDVTTAAGVTQFSATRCMLNSLTIDTTVGAVAVSLQNVIIALDLVDGAAVPTSWSVSASGLGSLVAASIGGNLGNVASPAAVLDLVDMVVSGPVFCTALFTRACFFGSDVTAGFIQAAGASFLANVTGNATLNADDCSFLGTVASPAAGAATGCSVSGASWTLGAATYQVDPFTWRSFLGNAVTVAGGVLDSQIAAGVYVATAATNDASGGTTFHAIVGAAFAQQQAGTGLVLTASGCIVTYTGPTRRFLVRLNVGVEFVSATANAEPTIGISFNGDLVGSGFSSVGRASGSSRIINGVITTGQIAQLQAVRMVTLSTGQFVQPVFCDFSISTATVDSMQLTVEPA